jgi:hypothetical protein
MIRGKLLTQAWCIIATDLFKTANASTCRGGSKIFTRGGGGEEDNDSSRYKKKAGYIAYSKLAIKRNGHLF